MSSSEQVLQPGSVAGRIDEAACTEAMQKLDAALDIVGAAKLRGDSPVVTAAEELCQSLQVCTYTALQYVSVFVWFCVFFVIL